MANEATGQIPGSLTSPKEIKITVVRLSPEDLTFESAEPLPPRQRVKMSIWLGQDKHATDLEGEITSSESVDDAVLCDARLMDVPLAARRRIVSFVNDVIREEYLKEIPAGTEIFREGEDSRHIYYVALGKFVVDKGGEKIAEITEDEPFVGEISFLLNMPRTATVTAMEDSLVMAIPAEVFQQSLRDNPKFGVELAKLLAKRLASTSQTLADRLHHL